MEWMDMLQQIMEVCVIPLLGILTAYIVKFVNVKKDELKATTDNATAQKYMDMIAQTVTDCVIATNQTYVEALKKDNAFTEEAQKKAFEDTYQAVMSILSDDAKEYITESFGDIQIFLVNKIEAEVNIQK